MQSSSQRLRAQQGERQAGDEASANERAAASATALLPAPGSLAAAAPGSSRRFNADFVLPMLPAHVRRAASSRYLEHQEVQQQQQTQVNGGVEVEGGGGLLQVPAGWEDVLVPGAFGAAAAGAMASSAPAASRFMTVYRCGAGNAP